MSLGILGKKIRMEHHFDAEGNRHAVTLIHSGPCFVTQIKGVENEGYSALQVGFDAYKPKQVNKAKAGHAKAAGSSAHRFVKEFRLAQEELAEIKPGQELSMEQFKANDLIDVTGISKGKGFAGVVKRHKMSGFPATHGTHEYFRHGGSIGCRFPQGTIKGLRMPGHMGAEQVTVQNLRLLEVRDGTNANEKVFVVAGAVPGNRGGYLMIKKAVKA